MAFLPLMRYGSTDTTSPTASMIRCMNPSYPSHPRSTQSSNHLRRLSDPSHAHRKFSCQNSISASSAQTQISLLPNKHPGLTRIWISLCPNKRRAWLRVSAFHFRMRSTHICCSLIFVPLGLIYFTKDCDRSKILEPTAAAFAVGPISGSRLNRDSVDNLRVAGGHKVRGMASLLAARDIVSFNFASESALPRATRSIMSNMAIDYNIGVSCKTGV